ncbi:MAG TPA: hypothetical protein VN843_10560 [Anaerolineales bacterium]|nr:hypothetical protein [Anaerolineales bacterium]
MIICFQCPRETKELMDALIRAGTYSEYSEVIAAAVHNLSVLETAGAGSRSLIINDNFTAGPDFRSPVDASQHNSPPNDAFTQHGTDLPNIFRSTSLSPNPALEFAPILREAEHTGDAPVDRWIFGQFSKFLPAKAACRALANLASETPAGFDLDKTSMRIAASAVRFGEYLAEIDRRHELARDEALAVGFPSNGENSDRSRLRFATQFVGTLTNGRPGGMLWELRLAGPGSTGKFNLTESGWRFATFHNPALDEGRGERLTREEIEYLLSHIRQHVPIEHSAYLLILNGVAAGADTPEKLDQLCKQHVSADRKDDLSDAFITTQRTGAVSRLNELGLIGRRRERNRVTYFVTNYGNEYLHRS